MRSGETFSYELEESIETEQGIWTVEQRVIDVDAGLDEVPREYVLLSDNGGIRVINEGELVNQFDCAAQ